MKADTIYECIESWDSIPFAGDSVTDIDVSDFSGAIDGDDCRHYLVNGNVVESNPCEIDAGDADAYEAPDDALPLLFAMVEHADTEVKYEDITSNTPLEETDETLRENGFVGYVKLTEEVLSGEYYCIYYGNRTMYVAFPDGEDVLIGEEAYDKAIDTIGLYEVVSTDISVEQVENANQESDSASESVDEATGGDSGDGDSVDDENDEETGTDETKDESVEEDPVEEIDLPEEVEELVEEDEDDETEQTKESIDEEEEPTRIKRRVERLDARVDELEVEIETGQTDADSLRNQFARMADEIDDIIDTQTNLEERITKMEQQHSKGDDSSTQQTEEVDGRDPISEGEALRQTDIFLRHATEVNPTLDEAVFESAEQELVNDNLRFEVHTQFDRKERALGDGSFEVFFEDRIESRFVRWLAEDLVYELRGTENDQSLRDLFETVPAIDRFDLRGSVSTGEESESTFDIVARDQRGRPLIVADAIDSLEPVSSDEVNALVEKASLVAEEHDSLAAAMFVTSSFYESKAVESAEDAMHSGLLDRKKKGYVKLQRKNGFHLCLVEGRDSAFHITIPNL